MVCTGRTRVDVCIEVVWSGEQDLNLRQLGDCGLGRLE
jgi:hypothetical protein